MIWFSRAQACANLASANLPSACGFALLLPTLSAAETAIDDAAQAQALQSADVHLRSSAVVIGDDIQASDGSIGPVQDLSSDDESWAIRTLVVDTRNGRPGGKKC